MKSKQDLKLNRLQECKELKRQIPHLLFEKDFNRYASFIPTEFFFLILGIRATA